MDTSLLRRAMACLLVCFAPGLAGANEAAVYRVDVIVFAHLNGESDQRHEREVSDFSDDLDPEANARAAAWTASDEPEELSIEDQARRDAVATLDQLRALENPERRAGSQFSGGPVFPTPWLALDGMAAEMVSAWQRLDASTRHRPLVWRSWHQPLTQNDSGRWIRLKGGDVLGLDWLTQEAVDPKYLDAYQPGPYRFLLPRSTNQLDGVIRVRRRQFMHVDFNLVWQIPVGATPSPLKSKWSDVSGFLIHPLEQSRSIRRDRIEYFDSSFLGALVRIEAWQSPLTEQRQADLER